MSKANQLLEKMLGISQVSEIDNLTMIRGILQTKNYENFIILSDSGDKLMEFNLKRNQILQESVMLLMHQSIDYNNTFPAPVKTASSKKQGQ